jgi:squalene-hopene/tetraprenyl-beta-curcumene cyclase
VSEQAFRNALTELLARRSASGAWEGRLSSSALSTATAVIALSASPGDRTLVERGRDWLLRNRNPDGGWGDTTLSSSNISTTALCWAALPGEAGATDPAALCRAIADRYGKDRTFSVPILTALAIGGRLGSERDAWRRVSQLPFELAACPHRWFQWLRLPVVSYALPALIAIGLARHRRRPTRNPVARALRNVLTPRVLRILRTIQPAGGGFLEATPLTSFVAMSLIAAGLAAHAVTQDCLDFLRRSVRADGSWPIDTNLSTWLTTLAINGLGHGVSEALTAPEREGLRDWLLSQQFNLEHPYTHAAPGAWSWTNLPGAVPDADDTAGALIALKHLGNADDRTREAAARGVQWLLDLQNRDGGMPTFCRGWGHLPFDRSGPDLTAHAIRAWVAWRAELPALDGRIDAAIESALHYLERAQHADGSWTPLWFGNQHALEDRNLTFGTARVVVALCELSGKSVETSLDAAGTSARATSWLTRAQNPDGGWGGAPGVVSSIEETALAIHALERAGETQPIQAGLRWLIQNTAAGTVFQPSPIGFYFASLWYFEELYPLLFSIPALRYGSNSRRSDTQ